jgi:CBS domain-containing protein
MDGGRVFRSLIWMVSRNFYSSTMVAAWTGRGIAWAGMGAGILAVMGTNVFIANNPIGGVWLILIGLFLENAARQSLLQTRVVRALERYRATDLMIADPPVVPSDTTIERLASGVLEINPRVCYFVEDQGRLAGIISAYQMVCVPQPAWQTTTAADAMVPATRLVPVDPERLASDILLEMENHEATHFPVVRDGRVIGVIGRDRILNVLHQAGFLRSVEVP